MEENGMKLGNLIKLRDKVARLMPDVHLTVERCYREEKKSGKLEFGLFAYTKDMEKQALVRFGTCKRFSLKKLAGIAAAQTTYALSKPLAVVLQI